MTSIHLNLDNAWPANPLGLATTDALAWGPRIRYFASEKLLNAFDDAILNRFPPFVLYGSGDFHHLAARLLRRIDKPVTLISFDNHPDFDIRPPRWACGGWVNRALELPNVQHVAVWGCGNFELNFPSILFANRGALKSRRIELHPWAERFSEKVQKRVTCMTRDTWRDPFEQFAKRLAGASLYVTIDLDCLRAEEASTNWENGLFTADDIAWALQTLRTHCPIVAGDLCGAYSPPKLERWTQRLASKWDHPRLPPVPNEESTRRSLEALKAIWPALNQYDPGLRETSEL
jgi:hypothetical protein